MSAPPTAPARHAEVSAVSAVSLAVLAGPMSFGIAGPRRPRRAVPEPWAERSTGFQRRVVGVA
ncbi:hypothetical protein AB0J28_47580, partial [Streptosporangium canum]|uniref:hypothetical protein n=1 Tax=Streptosporangium canum TaxID=324952 RepID=UPI0034214A29